MAENSQQSPIPLAPTSYGQARSDMEAAAKLDGGATEQQRRSNKRRKCFLQIFLFALFQTGIILLFTLTVMKIRTPKFRVQSATLDSSNVAVPTNSSLTVTMNAKFSVKNSNFGRFKFERTSVFFYYNGAQVAEAPVAKGRANWRSTKKFSVVLNVNVADSAELQRDLRAGVVSLSSRAQMRGNVRLVMVFKKKRSVDMNCTMEIVTGTQQLRNIVCD